MKKNIDLSYPRPLLKRKNNFISLNGKWNFVFDDDNSGEIKGFYNEFPSNSLTINVPYAYQSKLSGINTQVRHDIIWYNKFVSFDERQLKGNRVILHFEGSDYHTKVFVNKFLVAEHKGGYTRFSADITDALYKNGANIVVECIDTYDTHQPRGKQKYKDEAWGCWYQEINGIWKDVWLEIVKPVHINGLKLTANENKKAIDAIVSIKEISKSLRLVSEVYFKDQLVSKTEKNINHGDMNVQLPLGNDVHRWDVFEPNLYDVKFTILDKEDSIIDEVFSEFGFRTIEVKNRDILLNNKKLFMRLALEQGYYIDGIYTFKDEQEMLDEIKWIKDLGFNGIRMHQKVEDERFYYLCDKEGLIVFCEMPSPYDFDDSTILNMKREWNEVIRQFYNHPAILVWTPINESWGVPEISTNVAQQEFAKDIYHLTKYYDKTRLVISNDGWEHCVGDIITIHNYAQDPKVFKDLCDNLLDIVTENGRIDQMNTRVSFAKGYSYSGQPILIDEFCGIGYDVKNTKDGWGYGSSTKSEQEFVNRYAAIVDAAQHCKHIAGWCMTQLTDVYIEVNGLLTMERKPKADPELLAKINKGQ